MNNDYSRRIKPLRLHDIAFASVGDNWHKAGFTVGSDAVETLTGNINLVATGHAAVATDLLMFSDGGEESEPKLISSATTDLIVLNEALSGTPSAGESFSFVTPTSLDALEAPTSTPSTTVIASTAHSVTAKDAVMFLTGGEESEFRHAESVATDGVTLGDALTGTPSAGEEYIFLSGTVDAAEATTTDTIIKATAHAVLVGDLVWFVDGGETAEPRDVTALGDADHFTLSAALSGTPSAAEEFVSATPDSTDAVESSTTDTAIVATAHAASVNDLFLMTSGGEINEPRIVISVEDADNFTLNEALSGTPTATETFALFTPTGTDKAEGIISDTNLHVQATAHAASVNDLCIMSSGGEINEVRFVSAVPTVNDITLNAALSGTPSAAETFQLWTPTGTDAVESTTTDTVLKATAHSVLANDFLQMTTGGEVNELRLVLSVTTDTITLNEALSGTPSSTETFAFYRADGTDLLESIQSATRIIATAHAVLAGDTVIMTTGGEDGEARQVSVAGTDSFDLSVALSGTPSAAETFNILRPIKLTEAVLVKFNNELDKNVDLAFQSELPTFAHDQIKLGTRDIYPLKANKKHIGTYTPDELPEQFIWMKASVTPSSGSFLITIFE